MDFDASNWMEGRRSLAGAVLERNPTRCGCHRWRPKRAARHALRNWIEAADAATSTDYIRAVYKNKYTLDGYNQTSAFAVRLLRRLPVAPTCQCNAIAARIVDKPKRIKREQHETNKLIERKWMTSASLRGTCVM